MMESLSLRIAQQLKTINPEETPSINIMRYSIKLILLHVITFLLVILSGLIIGDIGDVMIALVSFAALRFFSGGYHIANAWICTFVSCLVLHLSVWLAHDILPSMMTYAQIFTVVLVLLFAPSNIQKQTNFKRQNYKWLKIISLIMCLINILFLENYIVASAFFIQGLTLLSFKKEEVR